VAVETLLVVFALVITVSMVVQAFFLWRLATSSRLLMDRLKGLADELESDGKEIMGQLRGIVESLQHLRNVSEGVETTANEINQMFGARVRDVDRLVGQLVEVGSIQAERVDAVVSDTVQKFEETTAVVQQDIVRPVVEISSIVKGLKAGLEYLFSKKQIVPEDTYPEDELFI
jgi:uncharacterized protein YoxC